MSIHKVHDGVFKIRWREGGRNRGQTVHGSHELAKKILRNKMSARDENRHLDVKREINFPVTKLIERYQEQYAKHKRSWDREKGILRGLKEQFGPKFVRELTGTDINTWYRSFRNPGTALRHFNVLRHMLGKAATIWANETGLGWNPARDVEVKRPKDERDRYLSKQEIGRLKAALDDKMYRKYSTETNRTFYRLRLIVLVALTTGMRIAEIFALTWSDLRYQESLIAVGAKLKGGGLRYVPMPPELSEEFRRYPAVLGQPRIFAPEVGAKRERQRVDKSFKAILDLAEITNFRFHDLRHTFASWYMMNGGDLYELAKILGHSNIKMTERYAKLSKTHIAKTGGTAREMWKLMKIEETQVQAVGAF